MCAVEGHIRQPATPGSKGRVPNQLVKDKWNSCEAAIRVEPKARLCEPWVNRQANRAPKGAKAL